MIIPALPICTQVSPRTSTSLAAVLGLRWPGVAGMLAPVGLTAVLFAVPLVYRALTEGQEEVQDILDTLRGGPSAVVAALRSAVADDQLWRWRNLVIAPISEEWVFRACMAPLLLMAVRRVSLRAHACMHECLLQRCSPCAVVPVARLTSSTCACLRTVTGA